MDQLLTNIFAPLNYIKDILSTAKGYALALVSIILAMNNLQQSLILLMVIIFLDYVTGIVASWVEHKKNPKELKAYFFESKKTRSTLFKVGGYAFFILTVFFISIIFFDQKIDLVYSSKQFTIVEIVVGICIANETWSNIENFKRMGFDLIGSITGAAKKIWQTIHTIKTGK